MQPVFTTNDAEFGRLEGLYIKERNPPAQLAGVSLNGTGVAGECVRGPVTKTLISGEQRFLDVFGGRDYGSGGPIIGKVWQALLNKKFGALTVARAVASDAVAASFTLEDIFGGTTGAPIVRLDASSVGAWGNGVGWLVQNATDGDATHWNLLVKYQGKVTTYKNLNTQAGQDNLLAELGEDAANLVVATKLADGRPANSIPSTLGADALGFTPLGTPVSGFVVVAGSNGTIADADFTHTGGPLDLVAGDRTLGARFIAERSSTALKAKMFALAGAASQGLFLIGADAANTTDADCQAEAADYRSDRIVYCHNHGSALDPETGTFVEGSPVSVMASILSQTDVDIHPGEEDTKAFTQGIARLHNEAMGREDYVAMKAAGICSLEKDDGVAFVSGVTTSLVPGREEITRRRMTDFLQLSAAKVLKYNVKKKNTETRRKTAAALLTNFCNDLAKAESVVDKLASGKGAFVVDTEVLNTESQRALGIEKILWRVKLIGHQLALVLETEIGTGVTIEAAT